MRGLGPYVQRARKQHKLSLAALAQRTGLSVAYLSDIELGKRSPSRGVLERLAQALGLRVEALAQRDPMPLMKALKKKLRSDPRFAYALEWLVEHNVAGSQLLTTLGLPQTRRSDRARYAFPPRSAPAKKATREPDSHS